MLDVLRLLTLGATAGMLFAAVFGSLPIRLSSRLALGAGIGAWITVVVAIAGTGAVKVSPLIVPALFALPLLAAGVAAANQGSRSAMMAIAVPLIVGLNVMRVLGVFMLVAAFSGTMSGPFPYSAGIGDVITGIFALPVARLAAKNPRDLRVLEWNVFGALDLVVAVALGITFARTGSAAMTALPWALIPLVLVPTYLIGHALVFAHIRAASPVKEGRSKLQVSGNAVV